MEFKYINRGRDKKGRFDVDLYEGSAWLMSYDGYITGKNGYLITLYPRVRGTGVGRNPVPGKHTISIYDLKNGG